jgi:hypothetical protein
MIKTINKSHVLNAKIPLLGDTIQKKSTKAGFRTDM